MERIKGRLNFIGNSRRSGSSELHSLLEIGNHKLRNLQISDYLDNYLVLGSEVEILVYKGMLSKLILGIRVNNQVYKTPWTGMLTNFILKTLVLSPFLFGIPFLFIQPQTNTSMFLAGTLGLGLVGLYFFFKAKHVSDLAKF